MTKFTFEFMMGYQNVLATDLPALSGSPKQIAWAETIRLQAISRAVNDLNVARGKIVALVQQGKMEEPSLEFMVAQGEQALAKVAAGLDQRTSAAWWIDRRDNITPAKIVAG